MRVIYIVGNTIWTNNKLLSLLLSNDRCKTVREVDQVLARGTQVTGKYNGHICNEWNDKTNRKG